MFTSTTTTTSCIVPPTLFKDTSTASPKGLDATLPIEDQASHASYEPFSPSFALKSRRTTPDNEATSCASTRALFDLEDMPTTPFSVSPSRAESPYYSPMRSTSVAPSKRYTESRASSPTDSFSDYKKPRARVTTKDFVPPDVSGLSKREARLVKNRAAAFLSRQRKREEFECMEIRVAELEHENARLRCQAEPETSQPEVLLDEIEQLRAQLAAAEQRTSDLSARLSTAQITQQSAVKLEPLDTDELPSAAPSPGRRSRSSSVSSQKPERSGANLGLMVLLCALPSLLSTNPSALSAQQSLSLPLTSAALQNSLPYIPSGGFDLSSSLMDIDGADSFGSSFNDFGFGFDSLPPSVPNSAFTSARASPAPGTGNTLGFVDGARFGLGNLDISFESAREDGKIRVKLHPPSAGSSRPTTPPAGYSPPHDPFLGVGDAADEMSVPFSRPGSPFEFSEKRRVRIALKSMPTSEGEGGEWEVELC